jgi:prepilin-type N-terminal cleavage/methylation domain-containing protein
MQHKKGFTLLELIIVMALLGILGMMGAAMYTTSIMKGRDAKRIADLKAIQAALEIYKEEYGTYPTTGNWLLSTSGSATWLTGLTSSYIKALPVDPKNSGGSPPNTNGNYNYAYWSGNWCGLTAGSYYILATRMEDTNGTACKSPKSAVISDTVSWPESSCGAAPVACVYSVSNP